MPESKDRVENAVLGKYKRLEQIIEALGFVVEGANVRRKGATAALIDFADDGVK